MSFNYINIYKIEISGDVCVDIFIIFGVQTLALIQSERTSIDFCTLIGGRKRLNDGLQLANKPRRKRLLQVG